MPRKITPLSDTQIKQAKPKSREYVLWDGDGCQLASRVGHVLAPKTDHLATQSLPMNRQAIWPFRPEKLKNKVVSFQRQYPL